MRCIGLRGILCAGLLASSVCAQTVTPPSSAQAATPAIQNYARLPLGFEKQEGASGEKFVARGQGYVIGLERGRATIGVVDKEKTSHAVSLEFAGSKAGQAIPGPEVPGKINYIRGNDPRKWQIGLSSYERVTYPDTYPGIDVVYYGNQQQLEFDLVVKPGADPEAIRLKVAGTDKLSIDGSGALVLGEAAASLRVALPQIYQEVNGAKKNVRGHYAIAGRNEVAFRVDPWDHTRPLVIDPTITYSALFGGGQSTTLGYAIALDSSGDIFIAGYTYDPDFPTVNAFQNSLKGYSTTSGGADAFVTKINPAGTALIYSTYLGGSNLDYAQGLAVDSTGAAWVTGQTQSSDFPVLNAAQPTLGGSADAFVARFNSAGVLQFSTYLGGSSYDYGYGIAVDSSNNGYVTGYTASSNFPTTAGVVNTTNASQDAFATKYSPAGTVLYSTLLGGANCCTQGFGIAADSAGDAYVTGSSGASTFTGAPGGGAQTTNAGGNDAFVAKLNPTGTALLYFTFLGGANYDDGTAIAVDASGDAYIGGYTYSTGLATAGAAQTTFTGVYDAFAAELNPAGSAFTYVTYLAGDRTNYLTGLALDGSGNVYLTGYTDSNNFPAVAAVQGLPINGVSLFNSTNSGASFSGFDSNIPGGAVSQISINPAGTSAVVLTEGGIYRTVNGGATWTLQFGGAFYNNDSFLTRSPAAPGTLYAAQCCAAIYQSTDDGVTWNFISNPTQSNGIQGILADPLNASTVYLFGGTSPYVFVSTDGGATFNPAGTGLPGQVNAMVSTTAGGVATLYAGTNGFGIYTSTNQGGSWTAANSGLPPTSYAAQNSLSASGTTVYFAQGYIYVTTNGGASWAGTPGGYVSADQVAASPQNASVLYAVTYNNTVVESSDGGTTWSSPATGLPSSFAYYYGSQLVVDPSNSAHVFLVVQIFDSGFVAKLNNTGSALIYSTYLGSSQYTEPYGIATDGAGNAFVTGYTSGAGFPITSTALPAGTYGAFITKISDLSPGCANLSVSPASALASQFGGALTFSVVTPSGCTYNASTDQPWAVISSGASGTGVGTVTVQITPQPGTATSSANLIVNGATRIPITLPGESCNYSLDMPSYPVPAAGGTVSAILTATPGCPYAVTNNYPSRVTVTSGASGSGSGTINLTVAQNFYNVPMDYFVSVGGTAIDIAQDSALLAVATTSVPSGAVGAYYATTLAAAGGTPPYSGWTVNSGSLPPGLTLNAATGVISGIPTTQTGSPFTFSVTVQDSLSNTSTAQSFTVGIGPFATYPGQNELLTSPRSTAGQPLLIPFVTNQLGFDTGITISNTTLDTIGTTAQSGTCTISFYGSGAPVPGVGLGLPGGTLAAGATTSFLLSSLAPGFQGYVAVNCTFPLVRGSADLIYNAGHSNATVVHETAQVLTLPRSVPATQNFLFPFVTNQAGFDTGIVLANTSSDPFGASGATPTAGSCTLNFYGAGAPTPNTGVAAPGGTLASGASTAFTLSSVAPGFQGYVIASCNFGAVAGFAFPASNLTANGGYELSETPEVIALPRSPSPQPLLFSSVSNQNGNDTGIAIANTSADPFGTTPASGACTLNFYGAGAPASPFSTPVISAGTVYTTTISAIVPGFQGYVTATCPFGPARGFSFVKGNVALNNYSESPEVVPVPRSAATPSTLLFLNTSNVGGVDTGITISNTSQDSFGTTPVSGICTINYSGTGSPGSFNTPAIAPGAQYSFLLSQTAPGFSGYIVASCVFPQARGIAESLAGTAPTITTTSLPGGTVGTAYSQTLAATGGVPPYNNWTPVSGAVPPGLLLNSATGVISGTPTTAAGSPFIFNVTVQDSALSTSAQQSLSIAIAAGPTLSSLSPVSAAAGNAAFTLTVNGTNFVSGSTVQFNGTSLSTTFVNATQLTATVTAGLLTTPGTVGVTVVNPGGATSNAGAFTITVPTLSTLSPVSTAAGNAAFTLTVNGTNFVSGSTVQFNGTSLSTTFINATQLTATVTAGLLTTPGTVGVTVVNPGGATSNAGTFTITVPTLSSLSPVSAAVGSPTFTLTVNGTNFVNGSTVQFNGTSLSTTFINATQLTASVTASLLTSPGSFNVTVVNPGGATSNTATFTLTVPTLSSLTPVSAPAGNPTFTLTVNGTNFVSGSTVQFNGTSLSTTFVNATQLTASVTAGLLTTPGAFNVTVVNPGGAASNAGTFTLLAPTISNLSPVSAVAGNPTFTLTVNGTNFVSGATVQFSGTSLSTTFVNATQLTATVTASLLTTPGTVGVTVVNPGGATSNAGSFTITAGATPVISGIIDAADSSLPPLAPGSLASLFGTNLASVTANASSVPLPFTLSGVSITVNGYAAALAFVSPGQINFQIPYEAAVVGTVTVVVTNGGTASAGFPFSEVPASPGISIIENTNASVNTAGNPIAPGAVATVFFTGLGATNPAVADGAGGPTPPAVPVASSSVTVGGLAASVPFIGLAPGLVGEAQANVVIPAALAAGSYAVIVTVGGRASQAATIYVSGSAPAITSVTPNSVIFGSPATPITISGSNFGGGSTVTFTPPSGGPVTLTPTSILATQIQVTIPAGMITIAGTAQVAVTDALGMVSNLVPFTITALTTQTITFGPLSNLFLGSTPPPLSATASSGLTVSFAPAAGSGCTVSGTTVTLTAVGTCTIVASQPGNASYVAAAPVTQSFTISADVLSYASAGIGSPLTSSTFGTLDLISGAYTQIAPIGYFIADLAVAPDGTVYALASPYSDLSAPIFATINPTTGAVTSIGPNTVGVESMAFNSSGTLFGITYAPTGPQQLYTVNPATGAATFVTNLSGATYNQLRFIGNTAYTTSYVTPSSLYTINLTTGAGALVGGTALNMNNGLGAVVGGQLVDNATVATGGQIFLINPATGTATPGATTSQVFVFDAIAQPLFSQTITFGPLSGVIFPVPPFTIGATASSGLAVSFGSITPGVCTVAVGTTIVNIAAIGTCTIQATQAGNADYAAATPVAQSFTVSSAAAPPLTISLSPGSISTTRGGSVSASFSVSGGTAPYTYSLGGQPAGVTLGTGSLSGTPTQAGIFNATVTVTDSNLTSASASITINVLGVTTTALPGGTTGQPYATSIGAAGGTGSYSFSATGLPTGLSLTSYGYLNGTATTAGTFPIGVTVSSGGLSATASLSLVVANAAALSVSSASLPGGTVNVLYSQGLSATGGVPPYTWSVISGTPPPGLSMSSSGIVSGTPGTAGSFSFGVQVKDTAGATATAAASLTIQAAPLIITTQSLPPGMNTVDYPQQQLSVSGGVSPYTWALASGTSLPSGMSLSSSGVLSGVPGAAGTFPVGVTVTDHANTQGSASFSLTIRPLSGDLILTSSSLAFSLSSPAVAPPPSQSVGVQSTVASTTITYTVAVNPAAPWLALMNGTTTPDTIQASLTPAALALSQGSYQTTITATCTSGSCNGHTQTVSVSLTVTATPPNLLISTGLVSFATTNAAPGPLSQPVNVQNTGGGSLGFASVSCEASWCAAGPVPQSLGGGASAGIPVTVNPGSLSPGFYRTQVDFSTSGGKGSVPVTLFISASATMTLAPAGGLFNQPAGSAPGNPNGSFLVSVNSTNTVNFSAAVLPGASWLVLGTSAGMSTSTQPGSVSYSINPAVSNALAVGAYYGEIEVTSPDISNSPQDFEVVLNVMPAPARQVPDPEPGGLLFITAVGTAVPSRIVTVYTGSVAPLTFQASAATASGGNWLSVTPTTGSASQSSPGVTMVSISTSGLNAGVYEGGVSYSLSATAIRTVSVTLIVASGGGAGTGSSASSTLSGQPIPHATGCTPSKLVPAQTGLVQSFFAPAGWPTPLQILLFDDCGSPVNNGQLVATFSNGDPPLALPLANPSQALYAGTWSPANPSSQVTINVTASAPNFATATSPLSGAVVPNAVPLLSPNGTLHVFDSLIGGALAPGTIVAIYGQNLASATSTAAAVPLPTAMSGTSVIIGGMQAPLYYVSPGQIDAQIPFELQSSQQYQVIVLSNGALTTPQPVQLTAATPGLAANPDSTLIAQHSDGSLVSQMSPARGGEYLVAYLAGLGDTTVPVPSGTASPTSPLASPSNTLVLTINGTQSPVLFAGLTPGLVGLYQMNFQVPTGLPAGNITVVVSQNDQASNPTILPYQP